MSTPYYPLAVPQYLPNEEYMQQSCTKVNIIGHHTVSSMGKGINVDDGFLDKGKSKVAPAYVVDKDKVYALFKDDSHWAYHLGMPDIDNKAPCMKSIAIEVVNEGQLGYDEKSNTYKWWYVDNKTGFKYPYTRDLDKIVKADFRGFKYWASYPESQIRLLADLIKYLCEKYNIPKVVTQHRNFDLGLLNVGGIHSHVNFRKSGKWDWSPAMPLDLLQQLINQR